MKTSRGSFLINRGFQFRFIFYSLFLVALVGVIVAASNLYFFQSLIDEATKVGVSSSDPFFQYLMDTKMQLLMSSIVASLAIGLIIIVLSLVLSHRIAGPIHHTVAFLQKRADGKEVGKLNFRDTDFFPELASGVNQLLEKIEKDEK